MLLRLPFAEMLFAFRPSERLSLPFAVMLFAFRPFEMLGLPNAEMLLRELFFGFFPRKLEKEMPRLGAGPETGIN